MSRGKAGKEIKTRHLKWQAISIRKETSPLFTIIKKAFAKTQETAYPHQTHVSRVAALYTVYSSGRNDVSWTSCNFTQLQPYTKRVSYLKGGVAVRKMPLNRHRLNRYTAIFLFYLNQDVHPSYFFYPPTDYKSRPGYSTKELKHSCLTKPTRKREDKLKESQGRLSKADICSTFLSTAARSTLYPSLGDKPANVKRNIES